ncbi:PHP domain-containing protein [candidate division KSB1 bacterium]
MRPKISGRSKYAFSGSMILILILVTLLTGCSRQPAYQIENPYADVDWSKYGQYKANLHTHTSVGEAEAAPEVVIDQYKSLDYSILAITDHDDNVTAEITWPWQTYRRDPETLGMVAIQGNEISGLHHIGSLFNDYGNPDVTTEEEVVREIGKRGGLAVFHHPGRYDKGTAWYVNMYHKFDNLIGQEVYNKRNRYPGDRKTWDTILTELLPGRPVWGFANDDMHVPKEDIGYSWNIILTSELTAEKVRQALEQGCFFFAHAPEGHSGSPVPVIEEVTADGQTGIIQIRTAGQNEIVWMSCGSIVHRGNSLKLADLPDVSRYVRAEVYGADSTVIGTQPFSIIRP